MRDILVYIAGPYSHGGGTREENVAIARKVALEYWKRGYAVICPHLNTHDFDPDLSYDEILEGDLEMVKRCDKIVMLPDWINSKGARREHDEARKWCLEIEYY
jgi:hypothetical protein